MVAYLESAFWFAKLQILKKSSDGWMAKVN